MVDDLPGLMFTVSPRMVPVLSGTSHHDHPQAHTYQCRKERIEMRKETRKRKERNKIMKGKNLCGLHPMCQLT